MGGVVGLYVHVPFCKRKCAYCDFVSYAGLEPLTAPYIEAVLREASFYAAREWTAETVYFGGGTPTVVDIGLFERLVDGLRGSFAIPPDAEVTVEANPGTVDRAYLQRLRGFGVTRLSLGAQALDDRFLRLLGRIHTASEVEQAVRDARQAGFGQVSLDLMFGLPGQGVADFRRTLEAALALEPEHLSLYALSVEEGTQLADAIESGRLPEPDPDCAADMYEMAEELLAACGYLHYEISNWAIDTNAICRHNMRYWRRQPYVGLGAGAHSFIENRRYANVTQVEDYITLMRRSSGERSEGQDLLPGAVSTQEVGSKEAAMAEAMFLGLRMTEGVRAADFAAEFGVDMHNVYGDAIRELVDAGLLCDDEQGVRLTKKGLLLGNQAFYRFLPAVSETGGEARGQST